MARGIFWIRWNPVRACRQGHERLPSKELRMSKLSSIELFTGAGGGAMATHAAGFRHLGLYEWNKDACATLRANARARAITGLSGWESHDFS